jgi:hypothetical protein
MLQAALRQLEQCCMKVAITPFASPHDQQVDALSREALAVLQAMRRLKPYHHEIERLILTQFKVRASSSRWD